MSGYIGTRCMVCNEKFTAEDDVVVCPECGTPYHRECYKKEGKCVNTVLHQHGRSWKPSYDTGSGESENVPVPCRFCGNVNPPLTFFCRKCGMPTENIQNESDKAEQRFAGVNINENPYAYNKNANGGVQMNPFLINFSDPLCGYSPDEDFDGVKMAELGDFVGTNTHYYLPVFKRIKETGKSVSWNFSAMIFPELYFAYRKMPLLAFGALIVRLITQIPQHILLLSQFEGTGVISALAANVNIRSGAFQGLSMLCNFIFYALLFACGLFGNKLYFNSALKKIKKIKSHSDGMSIRSQLVKKGGTSAIWLVVMICLVAVPGVLLYYTQFFSGFGSV